VLRCSLFNHHLHQSDDVSFARSGGSLQSCSESLVRAQFVHLNGVLLVPAGNNFNSREDSERKVTTLRNEATQLSGPGKTCQIYRIKSCSRNTSHPTITYKSEMECQVLPRKKKSLSSSTSGEFLPSNTQSLHTVDAGTRVNRGRGQKHTRAWTFDRSLSARVFDVQSCGHKKLG
jgi:hypothetical protein